MRSETTAIRVVLVTGLSGAGRSTALKMLEDLGYEAIDNLPLDLMNELLGKSRIRRSIALGVDTRSRDFDVETVMAQLDQLLARRDIRITVVFVDCEDEVLQRRFTETRRRHPLAAGRPLADGIAAERRLLVPLRGRADVVVDTSHLTPPEFRRILAGHLQIEAGQGLSVFVTSFAYRNGIPREADIVIDVRFLDNPHYDEALRPLTGRDPAVVARIAQDPDFAPFLEDLQRMLARLLPRYDEEGKSYLTVAFGCTGGQHRSVAVAEEVARWLRAEGFAVGLDHRDIPRSCAPESVEQQRTRRP